MQERPVLALPVAATAALTAYRFVQVDGTHAAANETALGVAQTDAASGDTVTVTTLGTAIVEAGAAVSAGATVKADASARAITWATSGVKLGIALTAATAAGGKIEVLLTPVAP